MQKPLVLKDLQEASIQKHNASCDCTDITCGHRQIIPLPKCHKNGRSDAYFMVNRGVMEFQCSVCGEYICEIKIAE